MIEYKLSGFSKFNVNLKDYNDFLKKSDKFLLILKNTKKISIFLEIEDKDLKNINNTLLFIFFFNKKITLKIAKLTFSKKILKEDILKNKEDILKNIILKFDDPIYNVDDLLDFTKSKYL